MSKEYIVTIGNDVAASKLEDAVCEKFSYNEFIIKKRKTTPNFVMSKADFIVHQMERFLVGSAINGQQKLDYKAMAVKYKSIFN